MSRRVTSLPPAPATSNARACVPYTARARLLHPHVVHPHPLPSDLLSSPQLPLLLSSSPPLLSNPDLSPSASPGPLAHLTHTIPHSTHRAKIPKQTSFFLNTPAYALTSNLRPCAFTLLLLFITSVLLSQFDSSQFSVTLFTTSALLLQPESFIISISNSVPVGYLAHFLVPHCFTCHSLDIQPYVPSSLLVTSLFLPSPYSFQLPRLTPELSSCYLYLLAYSIHTLARAILSQHPRSLTLFSGLAHSVCARLTRFFLYTLQHLTRDLSPLGCQPLTLGHRLLLYLITSTVSFTPILPFSTPLVRLPKELHYLPFTPLVHLLSHLFSLIWSHILPLLPNAQHCPPFFLLMLTRLTHHLQLLPQQLIHDLVVHPPPLSQCTPLPLFFLAHINTFRTPPPTPTPTTYHTSRTPSNTPPIL